MASSQNACSDKLMTPANIVTLVRICLVPVFVVVLVSPWPDWLGLPFVSEAIKRYIAAGIFILISATDWLDGYLARSRGEVTDFGKFMDPLADKILVVAALMALIELDALPSWVALIIVAREFIVSGVRMVAASKGEVIAASWYGKFKTVFQMIAIVLFTIKDGYMEAPFSAALGDWLWVLSWAVMTVALVLTIVSMLDYIAKARHLIGLGKRPSSSKAPAPQSAESTVQQSLNPPRISPSPSNARIFELSKSVVALSSSKSLKLATAESLTGGLIAANLTAVPGSSQVVLGGVVSYDAKVKIDELGVPAEVVRNDGVVSKACAEAMAAGVRRLLKVDISVAVTGIAGPGGAEPGKPVGTVWLACASTVGIVSKCCHFEGGREDVRHQTVQEALLMLHTACEAASQ